MLGAFLEKLVTYGLEFFGVYYGTYRGIVTSNSDPEKRGRIQARCPGVGHDFAPDVWIDPAFPFAGTDHGTFWPPEVGSAVRVSFENGRPSQPAIYWGGWFGEDDLPLEMSYSSDERPERRGFVTRTGHSLVFSEEPGSERIRCTWHKPDPGDAALTDVKVAADRTQGEFAFWSFEPDGSVQIANKNGSLVLLNATDGFTQIVDENGNTIVLDENGVKMVDANGNFVSVEGGDVTILGSENVHVVAKTCNLQASSVFLGDKAAQSVVLGEAFQTLFNTHTHGTGVGPSTPPQQPLTAAQLSKTVKVKT